MTLEEERKRWRVDLAVLDGERLRTVDLPAKSHGFRFDALLEFAYLDDSWTLKGANPFGEPAKRRKKVAADVEKIGRYLARDVCQTGYVVVFEACDWGFSPTFALDAELTSGCKVASFAPIARRSPAREQPPVSRRALRPNRAGRWYVRGLMRRPVPGVRRRRRRDSIRTRRAG